MDLKHIAFLAVIKLVLSIPEPEPDNSVNIDVKQDVSLEGGCGGNQCCPDLEPGCVFGGKSYPDRSVNKETCFDLLCNKGVWEKQEDIKESCGNCTLYGDPHIITYNKHRMNNGKVYRKYPAGIDRDEYALSRKGLDEPLFGVNASFNIDCNIYNNLSCLDTAIYYEPGIKVELIVPKGLNETKDQYKICQTATPKITACETKILVNGQPQSIYESGKEVGSFFGTGGAVLIFETKGSCFYCRNIYVVGSKGFTMRLNIDPFLGISQFVELNIYPMKYLQDQVYGLCDTFIIPKTHETNGYTEQNGKLVTNFSNIQQFINSWKVVVQ